MKVFQYLRNKSAYDIRFINELFVTSFLKANKLQVRKNNFLLKYVRTDIEDEVQQLIKMTSSEYGSFDLESLIILFEYVISPKEKIVNGAVYTPQNIRGNITKVVFSDRDISSSIKVADISCGCGGFLLNSASYIFRATGLSFKYIYKNCIYGIDIKDYAIERTKIILSLLALTNGEDENFEFNLWVANTLEFDFRKNIPNFEGFDIIVGNPPYVCSRNLDDENRGLLKTWSVAQVGHPDLYISFFQIGYENLKSEGVLGFITMNSFFKSQNGRLLRNYFSGHKVALHIKDFRDVQMFKSKSTYTCICFLKKKNSDEVIYSINDGIDLTKDKYTDRIPYEVLDNEKGWNLYENKIVQHIEHCGTPLGQYCKSSHGIATLCNEVYIFNPIREDNTYYYREYNNRLFKIEKFLCRNVVNSNKVNDTNCFEDLLEKIIYPYSQDGSIILENEFRSLYPEAYVFLSACKAKLAKRDKGKQESYITWYAFGRTQGLHLPPGRLFFPKYANRNLKCALEYDDSLLFYNGQAFVDESINKLKVVQKVIESDIFWEYIYLTSKPYHSGYYSLNGNYIKNFGVPAFNNDEIAWLIKESDKDKVNRFLQEKYSLNRERDTLLSE